MVSANKKFEYLDVSGSHYDVGFAIGKKFKDVIGKSIARRIAKNENYFEYLKRGEPFFNAAKESFPKLISEISGMAKGAGVETHDLFMVNCREVSSKSKKDPDHCTIAVSFGEEGAIVGHNEDWEGASPDALYILKANVDGTTFLGLQYKLILPGVAATLNSYGLVQCINELEQSPQTGVPKNFVARAVLECKTLDEAENLIKSTKRASGYNHVLVQGREVRNIEIAGDKLAVERVTDGTYVHTNHYLTPELTKYETFHTKSSEARYERAREIVKQDMDVDDMEKLLTDRKNKELPILRSDATLGSEVFIPSGNKVLIKYGGLSEGRFKEYNV